MNDELLSLASGYCNDTLSPDEFAKLEHLRNTATHEAIARFLKGQTRAQLNALAHAKDIPLHTLA